MTSKFFKNIILNAIFTGDTEAIPNEYYMGLSSSIPDMDNGSCPGELSAGGTGYKRTKINGFNVAENGKIKNATIINFPPSLISWGMPPYYVVFDAQEGGNLLFCGKFETRREIEPNSVLTIEPEILTIDIINEVLMPEMPEGGTDNEEV